METTKFEKEVFAYLTQTAKHTFAYTTPAGEVYYLKLFVDGETVKYLDTQCAKPALQEYNWKKTVNYCGGNAKCIISHFFFLNMNYTAVRQTKKVKEEISLLIKVKA